MNDISVQKLTIASGHMTKLRQALPDLPPELHKAACWLLEHPQRIAVSSTRQIAAACDVKPNSLVRLARAIGCSGFEDFKSAFIDRVEHQPLDFPDRARWLQSLSAGGQLAHLFGDLAESAIKNIEQSFAGINPQTLQAAATQILHAKKCFVMGVGINNTLARNFAYLGDMATQNIQAIPREGALAADDLARARRGDVLLAITFRPYRSEVVEAVELALEKQMHVIAISDHAAAPIFARANQHFLVKTDSPQFFSSTFSTLAVLEALMAFMIAEAGPEVVANIDEFNKYRHQLGMYVEER